MCVCVGGGHLMRGCGMFPCDLSHHGDISVDGGVFKFLITIWVNGNMSATTSGEN